MIAPRPEMDNVALDRLIQENSNVIDGKLGHWRTKFRERVLLVLTDEHHNRMRVMTPVVDQKTLDEPLLRRLLSANFDRALDAKYAISGDYLWSVFMHRLRELTPNQFLDALDQVVTLADNFGGSYSSGELVFSGS